MMEDFLSLKEAIVSYLDRTGGLQQLIADCKSFKGEFNLILAINFGMLASNLHRLATLASKLSRIGCCH